MLRNRHVFSVFFVVLMICSVCFPAAASAAGAGSMGDVDNDGTLTAADARIILRAAVGLEILSGRQRLAADADRDGWISAADARLVLRASVGLEALPKPAYFRFEVRNGVDGMRIYIPASDGYILYKLCHFDEPERKCNGWQIYHAYHTDDFLQNPTDLTVTGEWECAIRLAGRKNFSGGHTHGNEMMESFSVRIDTEPVDHTSFTTATPFTSLQINQTSVLYDYADSTSEIADHEKMYTFTVANGLRIDQTVTWKKAESLDNCYLAMFLPNKSAVNRAYVDDAPDDILILDSNKYFFSKPFANKVVMYQDGGGLLAEITAYEYPTGLPGGDRIGFGDNGGITYHKLYYFVCSSGQSSIGETWCSSVGYKLDYTDLPANG